MVSRILLGVTMTILRILNIILVITGIIHWVLWAKRSHKSMRPIAVAPISCFVNVGLFYIFYFSGLLPDRILEIWQPAGILHILFTMVYIPITMLYARKIGIKNV